MRVTPETIVGPYRGGRGNGGCGGKGGKEVKSAECAVKREENRGETAVCRALLRVLAVTFTLSERSFPGRLAKILFGGGFLEDGLPAFRCIREPGCDRQPKRPFAPSSRSTHENDRCRPQKHFFRPHPEPSD